MQRKPAARPPKAKNKKYMLVRYGRMSATGFFEHNETHIPKMPTRVVVKTDKGLELGHVVGQLSQYRACQFKLSDEQVKKYFDDSQIDFSCSPIGRVVRYATHDDISEERHLRKIVKEEIECCRKYIKELKLPMKIVDAEHIFGGERVIFYFISESRVDFRELVKKVAHEYQTRIEMRQVGSRDEAKLLGDVENCGQECCCRRFLKALKPVNMRMAKMQKATLDPSKISGYCGRLKCCLRYEDENYTKLRKLLPKKNTIVKSEHGKGRVLDSQILTQLILVEHENGEKIAIPLEELEIITTPQPANKKQNQPQQKKEKNNTRTKNENKKQPDKIPKDAQQKEPENKKQQS